MNSTTPTDVPGTQDIASLPAMPEEDFLTHRPIIKYTLWLTILAAALLWRVLGIADTEVWRDEAISLIHTQASWHDLLTRLVYTEDTPPLMFMIFKAWGTINSQEWFMRLLPVLIGVGWVHVIMVLAGRFDRRAWWSAGLLAAFSPIPVHFSQELRAYSLLCLLTAVMFWAAEKLLPSANGPARITTRAWLVGRRWFWVLCLLGALTAHIHAAGLFVMPAVCVYLLARGGWLRWRQVLQVLPLAAWLAAILPMLWFARHWTAIHQADGNWWIPQMHLKDAGFMVQRFLGIRELRLWILQADANWKTHVGTLGFYAIMLSAGLLVVLALLGRHRRLVLSLGAAGIVFVGLMALSSHLSLPNMLDRTLLPSWTPAVLILALGAAGAGTSGIQRIGRYAPLVLVGIWAATWAWVLYDGTPRRPLSRQAFTWMKEKLQPGDLIFTAPQWFKDQTVYGLSDSIRAEQMLDEFEAYTGQPPRHRLHPQSAEGWEQRFAAKLDAHQQEYGPAFNVWLVKYSFEFFPERTSPQERFLTDRCELHEQSPPTRDRLITISRYTPRLPTK